MLPVAVPQAVGFVIVPSAIVGVAFTVMVVPVDVADVHVPSETETV